MKAFYNGKLLDEGRIKISPFSTGFQYGKGFFTTLKYQNQNIIFLNEHLNRLKQSLKEYNMNFQNLDFPMIIESLVKENSLKDARIKIILFEENSETKILIFCRELNINITPISLMLNFQKRGCNKIYHHKTLNYLENISYKQELINSEFNDYLYVSSKNEILETSIHNIFFLKDNILFTPKEDLPILPGIIREKIINSKSIKVVETELFPENLSAFESAFVTNSIQGIIPVKKIDEIDYNVNLVRKIEQTLKNFDFVSI
jgi:4-amino-4-deoxychorismate lyase